MPTPVFFAPSLCLLELLAIIDAFNYVRQYVRQFICLYP